MPPSAAAGAVRGSVVFRSRNGGLHGRQPETPSLSGGLRRYPLHIRTPQQSLFFRRGARRNICCGRIPLLCSRYDTTCTALDTLFAPAASDIRLCFGKGGLFWRGRLRCRFEHPEENCDRYERAHDDKIFHHIAAMAASAVRNLFYGLCPAPSGKYGCAAPAYPAAHLRVHPHGRCGCCRHPPA